MFNALAKRFDEATSKVGKGEKGTSKRRNSPTGGALGSGPKREPSPDELADKIHKQKMRKR